MALRARHRNPAALAAGCIAGLALLVAACAGPQPPDWQANASESLRAYQSFYLQGETKLAEVEFRRAREQVSRTGRVELLARAELTRCAARAASLEFDECPGFQALRDLAPREEAAYADYLAGRGAHKAGESPLGCLVDAAIGLRRGELTPDAITAAVEIASAQGWRRPLLAWLGVQAKRADDAGDAGTAARIRRRIELVAPRD